MVCDKCGKNIACYHSKVIINGVVKQEHLCNLCANKNNKLFNSYNFDFFENLFMPFEFSFAGISNNLENTRKTTLIDDALSMVNKGAKKYKDDYDKLSINDKKLNQLKFELQEAVSNEDYEKAAMIKKEIDKLKEE